MSCDQLKILLVIPVYNNASSARGVVERAAQTGLDVLVVDDGSTDGSAESLSGLGFRLASHTSNLGKGAAIKTGARWAEENGFTHIITIDADGQHDPADVRLFIDRLREEPNSIIVGNRLFPRRGVPLSSRLGRANSNFWMFVVTGRRVPDTQSGFRAYPVGAVNKARCEASRYDFEIEMLCRGAWAGLHIGHVDISARYDDQTRRASHFRPLADNLRCSRAFLKAIARRFLGRKNAPSPPDSAEKAPPDSAEKAPPASPNYGGWLGHKIFHVVIAAFGVKPAYALLFFVVAYYVLVRPRARSSASYYLSKRFPGDGPVRRLLRVFRHFYVFGQTLVDQSAAGMLGRERVAFEFPDGDRLLEAVRSGSGVIFLTSHVGAWHLSMGMMGEFGYSVHFHFQEEEHTRGRHFFNISDKRDKFKIVSPSGFLGGMVELTDILQSGGFVAMMADRAWGGKTARAKFLGHDAVFPLAPYHLAAATGARVFMIMPARTGEMALRIDLAELAPGASLSGMPREEAAALLLGEYARNMERFLEANPHMWFNFVDIWKTAD